MCWSGGVSDGSSSRNVEQWPLKWKVLRKERTFVISSTNTEWKYFFLFFLQKKEVRFNCILVAALWLLCCHLTLPGSTSDVQGCWRNCFKHNFKNRWHSSLLFSSPKLCLQQHIHIRQDMRAQTHAHLPNEKQRFWKKSPTVQNAKITANTWWLGKRCLLGSTFCAFTCACEWVCSFACVCVCVWAPGFDSDKGQQSKEFSFALPPSPHINTAPASPGHNDSNTLILTKLFETVRPATPQHRHIRKEVFSVLWATSTDSQLWPLTTEEGGKEGERQGQALLITRLTASMKIC